MIDNITLWHKRARPEPTYRDFEVQLGCHIEEFVEMMDAITIRYPGLGSALDELEAVATMLKDGQLIVDATDRIDLLDALADQIVTAVGVGHCARMDMVAACQ